MKQGGIMVIQRSDFLDSIAFHRGYLLKVLINTALKKCVGCADARRRIIHVHKRCASLCSAHPMALRFIEATYFDFLGHLAKNRP